MSILVRIKGLIDMIFKSKAKEEFNIEPITTQQMNTLIDKCTTIYRGKPYWIDEDDDIKTINFAKAVCSETARLAMLGTKITIDGSIRAEWLQEQINKIYFKLREWVEYSCACGTVILKPNGKSVDVFTPDKFIIADESNGEITGIVFVNQKASSDGKKWYTRLEYHKFEDNGLYTIMNHCFIGNSSNDAGKLIDIKKTPWAELEEESVIENLTQPLYGVLKMPHANNVEINSPLGLPVFYDAIEELKDLDIAYSRNAGEIFDSKRTTLLDSDRLLPSGGKINNTIRGFESAKKELKLPRFVKMLYGNGTDDLYQEINPTLNTDTRLTGINALLSQIGYKVGFSNGYFVFNESIGIQTATGVEAEQQRTIQFIKDVRDKLEACFDGLIYALNAFADLYNFAPLGDYEVIYDFGDITYNHDEDRVRWYGYVMQGKVPFWYYLVKFEGFSEEEAKALEKVAQPKEPTLFGQEE